MLIALAVTTGCTVLACGDDAVIQRGAGPALEGRIISISDAGVAIRRSSSSDVSAVRTVSWDRVRDIQTDAPDPRITVYLPLAEDIWRARIRIERGDFELAEPMFERLFERYVGQTNETALVVAEGLLRCRIARMANDDAVIPMLEVCRLTRASVETEAYRDLTPVFDRELGLSPFVPPIWTFGQAQARLKRDLDAFDAKDDAFVGAVRSMYARALTARDLNRPRRAGEDTAADDLEQSDQVEPPAHDDGAAEPAIALLSAIIASDANDWTSRNEGRNALARMSGDLPLWCSAWTEFWIARSLMRESQASERLRGLLGYAGLPASRQRRSQRFLAGLAMAALEQGLRAIGHTHSADTVRESLYQQFSTHPAVIESERGS